MNFSLKAAVAAVFVLSAGAASAVSVIATEGGRAVEPGSTIVIAPGDVNNTPPGFDLGVLDVDMPITVYGRIGSKIDYYFFDAKRAFRAAWVLSPLGSDGLNSETPDPKTIDLTIDGTTFPGLTSPIAAGTPILGPGAGGTFAGGLTDIVVNGFGKFPGQYNITFTPTPVPVPAALPMLVAAMAGIAYLGRRSAKS